MALQGGFETRHYSVEFDGDENMPDRFESIGIPTAGLAEMAEPVKDGFLIILPLLRGRNCGGPSVGLSASTDG